MIACAKSCVVDLASFNLAIRPFPCAMGRRTPRCRPRDPDTIKDEIFYRQG